MFADATVLTIAHRLDTIMQGDRVVVMHAGQAVESVLRVLPRPELTITLTGDTWRPQVGNETDLAGATQALLSNIFSTQSEPYGWNAVVRQSLTASSVKYVSANEIVITVPATPALVTTMPAAVETISAGICETRPSPTVSRVYVSAAWPNVARAKGTSVRAAAQFREATKTRCGLLGNFKTHIN